MERTKIHLWDGLCWDTDWYDINNIEAFALCPRKTCHCRIVKSKDQYSHGEYKYDCIKCDFKITLNKSIEDKATHFLKILESQKYKDAEIINIDGDLVRIQREQVTDNDYWIDAKLSKNTKGDVQLMVLAGSKNEKDKAQLFLDIKNEKLTFDQNNDHPSEVFAVVTGTFKNSETKINLK
jgi:hypothetical protein